MKMSTNETIRVLFSVCLIPLGAVMILLHTESPAGTLLSHIGFAFIVAGVLSAFHEAVLRRFEQGEAASAVAEEVHSRLRMGPLSATGIRLVSPIRKGYAGYYQWVMSTGQEDMFFAGRSVLHRIDADFRARGIGNAESILARRLADGAKIKILLVDPRSEIIPRLAKEEGQTPQKLLSDVAISLGVCVRLHELLKINKSIRADARLDIRVFDQIPYFAYHSVGDQVILGFYFSSSLGYQSAAYEIVDSQTKEFFAEHFRSILSRASDTYVLRINPHSGHPELNESLIADLRVHIAKQVGDAPTTRLMNGEAL
jgi:hypothetical protein